ncbi:hypothetical protein GCM10023096_48140 [Nonomuraea ferruginea]
MFDGVTIELSLTQDHLTHTPRRLIVVTIPEGIVRGKARLVVFLQTFDLYPASSQIPKEGHEIIHAAGCGSQSAIFSGRI